MSLSYENQTRDVILQRMLDNSRPDVDKRQGAVTYDLSAPAAIEIEGAYLELDTMIDKAMLDTSYDDYLTAICAGFGIDRKPAIKATGQVTFQGHEGTFIQAGTQVSTDGTLPVFFVVLESGVITDGKLTLAAEARDGGISGNVETGAIKLTQGDLTGITDVTNEVAFRGGVDEEPDEELRERCFDRLRRPVTSGNIHHYRQWAKEIAGIGDAKVYPIWNGNGTVKVALIDSNKRSPAHSKIAEVAAHIEKVRPIGATVTVVGATELPINVESKLTLQAGASLSTIKPAVSRALTEYLRTIAFKEDVIRYSRIANILLDAEGVIDYAGLKVNGGTSNVVIPDSSVGVPGTVTLT